MALCKVQGCAQEATCKATVSMQDRPTSGGISVEVDLCQEHNDAVVSRALAQLNLRGPMLSVESKPEGTTLSGEE